MASDLKVSFKINSDRYTLLLTRKKWRENAFDTATNVEYSRWCADSSWFYPKVDRSWKSEHLRWQFWSPSHIFGISARYCGRAVGLWSPSYCPRFQFFDRKCSLFHVFFFFSISKVILPCLLRWFNFVFHLFVRLPTHTRTRAHVFRLKLQKFLSKKNVVCGTTEFFCDRRLDARTKFRRIEIVCCAVVVVVFVVSLRFYDYVLYIQHKHILYLFIFSCFFSSVLFVGCCCAPTERRM